MSEEIRNIEENKTSSQENDLSKVKIRHILAQRLKKYGSKRIIGIILLAAVSFCGGLLTDRLIMRHRAGRGFYGRAGIQRNMPGNFKGNDNFKAGGGNRTKQPKSNNNKTQNPFQGSTQNDPKTKQ